MASPSEDKILKALTQTPMLVGMVANSWAAMEHTMVYPAMCLLQTESEHVAKVIMISATPPQRRDLFLALSQADCFTAEQKAGVKEFCDEFERLRKLRNDIVHGHWTSITADGVPIVKITKGRAVLRETLQPKEISSILTVKDDIDRASLWCLDLVILLRGRITDHVAEDARDD